MSRPEQGDVWSYSYLWRWQHERGETEGRKSRPSAFVATVASVDGRTDLFILAITKTEPGRDRLAIEIPQMERARAGLAADLRLWIMLDEYNHDHLETSFYLEPNGYIGKFSSAFHKQVLSRFVQAAKERRVRRISRND
jgi:hypothetical protein